MAIKYVLYLCDMLHTDSLTVLVDMNGVQSNFDGKVTAEMQRRHPDIRPLALETPHFYTAENYTEEDRPRVWAISNEPHFEATLPVIPGAVEGWGRILEAGYTPKVCSTPRPAEFAPTCIEDKKAWLEEHFVPRFGSWVIDTAIFTPHKHQVPGMALIDDKPPPISGSNEATWEHIIFDRPCNRTTESETYIRLEQWYDPALPDKLAEAQQRHLAKLKRRS
jgi:5'-nucleotidase